MQHYRRAGYEIEPHFDNRSDKVEAIPLQDKYGICGSELLASSLKQLQSTKGRVGKYSNNSSC